MHPRVIRQLHACSQYNHYLTLRSICLYLGLLSWILALTLIAFDTAVLDQVTEVVYHTAYTEIQDPAKRAKVVAAIYRLDSHFYNLIASAAIMTPVFLVLAGVFTYLHAKWKMAQCAKAKTTIKKESL